MLGLLPFIPGPSEGVQNVVNEATDLSMRIALNYKCD